MELIMESKESAMQTYQALLARADNVTKAPQMRRTIERIGGKIVCGASDSDWHGARHTFVHRSISQSISL